MVNTGSIGAPFYIAFLNSITDFLKEVYKMSNFNRKKGKQQLYAIIGLLLVAAMLITTFVSAFFV
jgi:hypothetical protein